MKIKRVIIISGTPPQRVVYDSEGKLLSGNDSKELEGPLSVFLRGEKGEQILSARSDDQILEAIKKLGNHPAGGRVTRAIQKNTSSSDRTSSSAPKTAYTAHTTTARSSDNSSDNDHSD